MSEIKFGQSNKRREDVRFLTGRGTYTDDIQPEGCLHVFFVRAQMASARIAGLNVSQARAYPGVIAVLTADDLTHDGIPPHLSKYSLRDGEGNSAEATPRPLLIKDQVRFLGEPLAMIIADDAKAAEDASELVDIDYEALDAVCDIRAAMDENAPLVWENRDGNLAFRWRHGDFAAVDAAFANAHHITRLTSHSTRVAAMPLEPRSAVAHLADDGRITLTLSHQNPHQLHAELAHFFKLDPEKIQVLVPDVGGSFGMKSGLLREEALIFWAAMRLDRPVKWAATRSETFLSDEHGRDVLITTELALDADGNFTALKVHYDINVGAYLTSRSASPIANFGGIAGVYRTPAIAGEAFGYFSHSQPTAAYRGAGRPDATYAIERVIDVAAAEMNLDRFELRRRNLIGVDDMPFQTPFIYQYDCGEFARNMDRALELSDYSGFSKRRADALQRGKWRGFGLANSIEVSGGPYAKPGKDLARIEIHSDGRVSLYSGQMSVGQGLETALTDMVAQRLGIDAGEIDYHQGDTVALSYGKGSGGSSALAIGAPTVMASVRDVIKKALSLAAEEMEAAEADIVFSDGEFRIVGTDRVMSLQAVAEKAAQTTGGNGLSAEAEYASERPTFPNGCHICEVEIDPETGVVEVQSYLSVEDVGPVFNPMLVEGQIHGGVAQGLGQVLMEEIRYDSTGQMITGSFMDYAMPRATMLTDIRSDNPVTPTAVNPLGVKGVGEAGTVGAMSAGMNAVCDALQQAGIRHMDMPTSPHRVWSAIREAQHTRNGMT